MTTYPGCFCGCESCSYPHMANTYQKGETAEQIDGAAYLPDFDWAFSWHLLMEPSWDLPASLGGSSPPALLDLETGATDTFSAAFVPPDDVNSSAPEEGNVLPEVLARSAATPGEPCSEAASTPSFNTTPMTSDIGPGNLEVPAQDNACAASPSRFKTRAMLRERKKKHSRPHFCPVCEEASQDESPSRSAQKRDLNRHIWAKHPEYAMEKNVPTERRSCPFPGCEVRGRMDNLTRHCRNVHGKKIAWKKGMMVD